MQYDASTTDRHESDQLSKKITSTKLTKNSMPKYMNVLRLHVLQVHLFENDKNIFHFCNLCLFELQFHAVRI